MTLPAAVSAILVQSSLYSIYVVLFIGSLYLLTRSKRGDTSKSIAFKSSLQFALVTTLWIVNLVATFSALKIRPDIHLKIEDFLPLVVNQGPQSQTKIALYVVQNALFEAFLVHHLYLVFQRSLVKVFVPALLVVGSIVTGILSMFNVASGALIFLLISMVLASSANIILTGMIIYRMKKANRTSPPTSDISQLASIAVTLIESAALYTVFALLAIIFLLVSGHSFESFFIALSPIIGINYALLVVLNGLGLSSTQDVCSRTFERLGEGSATTS